MNSTYSIFFFFNDTATTEIYTLSLHDALPICLAAWEVWGLLVYGLPHLGAHGLAFGVERSEEHTSELQSRQYLVCRLLLEKKKNQHKLISHICTINLTTINLLTARNGRYIVTL